MAHVINIHYRALAMLDKPQQLVVASGGDLAARWPAATEAMLDAVSDQDQSSRTIGAKFGGIPSEWLVNRLVCTETLIHSWDLASRHRPR